MQCSNFQLRKMGQKDALIFRNMMTAAVPNRSAAVFL